MIDRAVFKVVGIDLVRVNFEGLEIGDNFKMIEPAGSVVKDGNGFETFVAMSNPYMSNGKSGVIAEAVEL